MHQKKILVPKMIKIVVANVYSKIVGHLPDIVNEELDRMLSYRVANAIHIPKVKEGKWDGIFHLYMKSKGQSFYTGLMSLVRDVLKKHNIPFVMEDTRIKPSQNLPDLKFTPPDWFQERDYQTYTIERSQKFTRGILEVATGGGKTMMVTKLIGEIKTYPFIFYVLTKDLMQQAYEVLSSCLNEPIGRIGDGECDIKKINVCTIQTAVMALNQENPKFKISDYQFDDEDEWDEKGMLNAEKFKSIKNLIESAKVILVDECVSGEAKIETELGEISLAEAVEKKCRYVKTHDGNNIVYKSILNWWKNGIREALEIQTSEGGKIICTKNHLVLTQKGWVMAKNLTTMDSVLSVAAAAERYCPTKNTINISQESTFSDIRLRREASPSGKKYMSRILKACHYAIAVAASKCRQDIKLWKNLLLDKEVNLGTGSSSSGTTSNPYTRNIILNQLEKRGLQFSGLCLETPAYPCRTDVQEIFDCVQIIPQSKQNGFGIKVISCLDSAFRLYLRTILDMAISGQVCLLSVCQLLLKSAKNYMTHLAKERLLRVRCLINWVRLDLLGGFATTAVTEMDTCAYIRKVGLNNKMILLRNGLSKMGMTVGLENLRVTTIFTSRENRLQDFLKLFRPTSPSVCDTSWTKVKSVKLHKKIEVYDIEVEDVHCFFANGILVHNCHHVASRTTKEVMTASKSAYWRYGCSATPYRESGDEIMIQAMFGAKIVSINASYLIKKGVLVKPYIFFEPIESACSYHSYQKIYDACVVNNEKLNNHIADTANHLVKRGLSTLVLVQHFPQGDYLKERIAGAEFITSRLTSAKRKEILDKLRSREIKVLIGTSLLDEGVDVPCLDAVLMAGGGASCTRVNQRIGRALRRTRDSDKDRAVVVIYEHNAKYLSKHADKVRRILKREEEFVIRDSKGINSICDEIDAVLNVGGEKNGLFER